MLSCENRNQLKQLKNEFGHTSNQLGWVFTRVLTPEEKDRIRNVYSVIQLSLLDDEYASGSIPNVEGLSSSPWTVDGYVSYQGIWAQILLTDKYKKTAYLWLEKKLDESEYIKVSLSELCPCC